MIEVFWGFASTTRMERTQNTTTHKYQSIKHMYGILPKEMPVLTNECFAKPGLSHSLNQSSGQLAEAGGRLDSDIIL